MEYLEKKIELPGVNIPIESVESKTNFIEVANDLIYKESKTARGWMSQTVGIMLIIFALFGFIIDDNLTGTLIILAVFGLPGIGCIIYGFVAPLKYLVYDRLNDKLTVYRNFRSSVDISFSKGYGVRSYTAIRPGTINQHLTFVSSKEKPRVGGIITELKVDQYWAFTVWYMDKNRPLPPGTVFDPYRQKDFERRKAAGFPRPLYPADFETPEANPEQQAQRKQIGGWQIEAKYTNEQ